MTTQQQKEISKIVTKHLDGCGQNYLEEIASHGIHNLTNDFNGENYEAFAAEFESQARQLLAEIDDARAHENNQEYYEAKAKGEV